MSVNVNVCFSADSVTLLSLSQWVKTAKTCWGSGRKTAEAIAPTRLPRLGAYVFCTHEYSWPNVHAQERVRKKVKTRARATSINKMNERRDSDEQ